MYQSGSISSPGTCIQGRLLQYLFELDSDRPIIPLQEGIVSQCGAPSILIGSDGSLRMFVAGQADAPSSPSYAPWPLSPLSLCHWTGSGAWDLTRLPDTVNGIRRYVSGIPSAVANDRTTLVYFNGGQLLEYESTSGTEWRVSAIPVPDIVVDANPVAILAGDGVFIFSAPRGEALLLCRRPLDSMAWRFADLGSGAPVCGFAGDPAVAEFGGILHVFACAAAVQDAFELWDFRVNPDGAVLEAVSVSGIACRRDGTGRARLRGRRLSSPRIEACRCLCAPPPVSYSVFTQPMGSGGRVRPFRKAQSKATAAQFFRGDANSIVYASDRTGRLTEFRENDGNWHERWISYFRGQPERWPRPAVCGRHVYVFDLNTAV